MTPPRAFGFGRSGNSLIGKSEKTTMISEVHITPIKPSQGLVAFASVVVSDNIFLGSIGVHRKTDGSGYRITYPTRKVGEHDMHVYHPINKDIGNLIKHAIEMECHKLFNEN